MNVTTVRGFWKKSAAVALLGIMLTVSACACFPIVANQWIDHP